MEKQSFPWIYGKLTWVNKLIITRGRVRRPITHAGRWNCLSLHFENDDIASSLLLKELGARDYKCVMKDWS